MMARKWLATEAVPASATKTTYVPFARKWLLGRPMTAFSADCSVALAVASAARSCQVRPGRTALGTGETLPSFTPPSLNPARPFWRRPPPGVRCR